MVPAQQPAFGCVHGIVWGSGGQSGSSAKAARGCVRPERAPGFRVEGRVARKRRLIALRQTPGSAPSGLVNLAHLPPKTLGEVGVTDGWDASTGIELRPRAPPPGRHHRPTSPKNSWGRCGDAEGLGLVDRHRNWRPTRRPSPRPLPARSSRRGENSIPLLTGASHLPPPTQFVGEGRGGGRLTISHALVRNAPIPAPHPTSPRLF